MNTRTALLHLAASATASRAKPLAAALVMGAALHWPAVVMASPVTTYTGSASISNLRISVVDLDLADGVAAGYVVVNPNGHHAEAGVWDGSTGPLISQSGTADWWTSALHAGAMSSDYSAQADISAGVASASWHASGYALDMSVFADWMSFRPDASGHVSNWLLAAHTRLIISADAQVQDQFTGCAVLGCVSVGDAAAGLEAGMFGPIDTRVDDFLGFHRVGQYDGIQRAEYSDSVQRTVTITLDNPGDQSRLAYGRLAAGAWVYSYATPPSQLPEPSGLALLALGMAASWRGRRHVSHAPSRLRQ